MPGLLNGKRILILTTNIGIERDELVKPLEHLRSQGAVVVHAAIKREPVQTFLNDTEKDIVVTPDADFSALSADDFDALVIPGGTVNADNLRVNETAISLAKGFAQSGKPVAAICHGPWLLVEADLLPGKTLTSYHTVRTDILNAGGEWVDESVVKSKENGWTLITSRNPGDLDAFSKAITEELQA
jgi:protease I